MPSISELITVGEPFDHQPTIHKPATSVDKHSIQV
jgi:hypothetical protein